MTYLALAIVLLVPVAAAVVMIRRGRQVASPWLRAGGLLIAPLMGFVLTVAVAIIANTSLMHAGTSVCGGLQGAEFILAVATGVVDLVLVVIIWLLLPPYTSNTPVT